MDFISVNVDCHVFAQLGAVQCLKGQDHDVLCLYLRSDVSTEPRSGEGMVLIGITCYSSIAILIYGYAIFQKRLTMISARDAAQFGRFMEAIVKGIV